jgi:protein-disulfide isomerase
MLRAFAGVLAGALALAVGSCGPRPPASEPAEALPTTVTSPEAALAPVLVTTSEKAALLPEQGAASVPVTAADPQWGDPLAPVTIVEFSDFECPFCSRVNPTLARIRETYGPSRVRIVWKNAPLPFHKEARPTADAAQTVFALAGSNAFWKFHDQAFANQQDLTAENHEKWASAAGVDVARFREALAARRFVGKVDEDLKLAKNVGANGTPAFRINGVTVSGAQPFEKFEEVVDAELAEAKRLVDSGTSPRDLYVVLTNRNFKEPAKDAVKATEPDHEDLSVWKVPVFRDDPVRGPADALVTIVEFSEFQCPFCKRVEETLEALLKAHPKDVRLVWKDNPLPFHPRARPAAIMARLAYEKRGNPTFWKMHDELFKSQPALEEADFRRIAQGEGVSWDPIARAIEKNVAPKVEQSMDLANDFAARGTPHFFINGVRLSGAQPLERFEERVADALEAARDLVARGVPRSGVYEVIIKNGKLPEPPEQKQVPAPDATTPFRGDPSAPVVIQEFADFQCPFCERVLPTLAEVEKEFGSKVKIVWRHLPLPFHQDAQLAAEAAQEVFAQKGSAVFWRYHDALFEAQETGIGRDVLESIAQRMGVDMPRFRRALDSQKHRPKVDADAKIASDAGINGTPSFVINGYLVAGAQSSPAFKKVIRRALDEKKKR